MAGGYNDAVSRRMAWDADGTTVLRAGGASNGQGPPANTPPPIAWSGTSLDVRENANNEYAIGFTWYITSNYSWYMHGMLFPEDRDIDGWYENVWDVSAAWESYSLDTTNLVDGTWNSATVVATQTRVLDHWRDNVNNLALTNVKGLMSMDGENSANREAGRKRVHIYGTISAGETPDRILFLDTENGDAEFTKVLDFGDQLRGTETLRTFKIKNNSASLEIFTIQITAEDLYANAGGWYEFGDDGISYQATYSAGDLDFDEELLIYMKQVIPDGETLIPQAARIRVSHASVS